MTVKELKVLRALQEVIKDELGESMLSSIINSWKNPKTNITDSDMLLMLRDHRKKK